MRLQTVVYLPGDTIMRKGENSDWMGFIGRGGKVAILDPTIEERRIIKILHEGDYIGEIALLFNIKRTADVEAFTLVRMHVLTSEDFFAVKKLYPLDAQVLHKEMERYLVTRKRYTSTELEGMKMAAKEQQKAWRNLSGHKKSRRKIPYGTTTSGPEPTPRVPESARGRRTSVSKRIFGGAQVGSFQSPASSPATSPIPSNPSARTSFGLQWIR